MGRFLIILITVVLLFTLGLQVALANVVEQSLAQAILKSYPLTEGLDVHVSSGLALKMLWGNIDNLEIRAQRMFIGDAPLEDFRLYIQDLQIDPLKLVRDKQFSFNEVGAGKINVTVFEKTINQQLAMYNIAGLTNPKLILKNNQVEVRGQVDLLAGKIDVICYGNLAPGKGPFINFLPTRISFGGYNIPKQWEERLLQQINFAIPLPQFPLPIEVKEVKVLGGKVVLEGIIQ